MLVLEREENRRTRRKALEARERSATTTLFTWVSSLRISTGLNLEFSGERQRANRVRHPSLNDTVKILVEHCMDYDKFLSIKCFFRQFSDKFDMIFGQNWLKQKIHSATKIIQAFLWKIPEDAHIENHWMIIYIFETGTALTATLCVKSDVNTFHCCFHYWVLIYIFMQ